MGDTRFTEMDLLERITDQVGTPFFLYDAEILRDRIRRILELTAGEGLQARYAMKALSVAPVLQEMKKAGLWIDAVSGNEVLRAKASGYPMGAEPPEVLLTADAFRDNAREVLQAEGVLPNLGSPGQLHELIEGGYRGPAGIRVNPGFGHGHVQSCDTGGPSSKHGVWPDELAGLAHAAEGTEVSLVLLHAHVGSGPQIEELEANLKKLSEFFAEMLGIFPDLEAVNLGGGFPHDYRTAGSIADLSGLGRLLRTARERFCEIAGRPIRVEVEPGRFLAAACGALVSRVTDRKQTRDNDKGQGHDFLMVDAGFCDLVRPAMYGAYHRISVVGHDLGPATPLAVAGPLCESGDLFTRDADELIEPRMLPAPHRGDFLVLHDAGAYGASMSSNYNSLGKAPQIWLDEDGPILAQRRETLADLLALECHRPL
jgi:diaminopimelate decarboxylase